MNVFFFKSKKLIRQNAKKKMQIHTHFANVKETREKWLCGERKKIFKRQQQQQQQQQNYHFYTNKIVPLLL